MSTGVVNRFVSAADQPVTSSVVLVDATGLTLAVAAGQTIHVRLKLFFSVGATGGIRLQLVVPAAVVSFNGGIVLQNTVAPSQAVAFQAASAAFTNALANAGSHFVDAEFTIKNGVNAGSVKLQFAQNTSDVLTMNLLRGSWMETTQL